MLIGNVNGVYKSGLKCSFFRLKNFFWHGPFLTSLLNLLQYCFCFMFWFLSLEACGILPPQPGIKSSALEGEVLTTGPPGKSLNCSFTFPTDLKFFKIKVGSKKKAKYRSLAIHMQSRQNALETYHMMGKKVLRTLFSSSNLKIGNQSY